MTFLRAMLMMFAVVSLVGLTGCPGGDKAKDKAAPAAKDKEKDKAAAEKDKMGAEKDKMGAEKDKMGAAEKDKDKPAEKEKGM